MITCRLAGARLLGGATTSQRPRAAVRALVLLGGVLRPTLFHTAIGRSVLDLPISTGRSVLQHWMEHAAVLARTLGNPSLGIRLLLNKASMMPASAPESGPVELEIQHDPAELRGTGGILRDVAAEYGGADQLLVASAAQILLEPVETLAAALCRSGADVALIAHRDGTPSSMMIARCRCLDMIPGVGFIDMKEQALPLIARRYGVKVICRDNPTGLSLLTFTGYLAAVRRHHRTKTEAVSGVFAEDWRPCFTVIEDGAAIEHGAKIHDSVVLRGASVGRGAVIVRSLLCPGAKVGAGRVVVDRMVTPMGGWACR